jgi:ABC-type nitrate/sulfonate/bicarbonate transport system substrate-binding protein
MSNWLKSVGVMLGALVSLSANAGNEKVTFALDWTPNTNHTGIYVAKARGFYAKEGLDVSIIQPTQSITTTLVATGKADFGVSFTSDLIHARLEGLPLVSVAAILQENTSCLAWRESAGIKTPKDWEGKRYGGWGSPEEAETLRYIMQKNGADFSKLKIVTTGVSDFLPTTEKNADFMWIYMGWDGIRAKLAGVKIQTLCPSKVDAAFNNPSPLLVTSEKLLRNKPELARKFLKATAEGYKISVSKPTEAAADLLKEVPELDKVLVNESAKYLAGEYSKGLKTWGNQDRKRFDEKATWMKNQRIIKKIPASKEYVSNDFLPEAGL